MGKHSAPRRRKRSFIKRYGGLLLIGGIALILTAVLVTGIAFFLNPYQRTLTRANVEVESCKIKKDVLYLTFEGDAEGILSCRKALSALRAETPPEQVEWTLTEGDDRILSGTIKQVGYIPPSSSPRVETLSETLTLLKLKYELARSGISGTITAHPTVGAEGKTIRISIETPRDNLEKSAAPIPTVLATVNREGGGIVRCDVLFLENGNLFAAASYDLLYGDTLLSSLLQKK